MGDACKIDFDDIEATTDDAILLNLGDGDSKWIPRSQVEDASWEEKPYDGIDEPKKGSGPGWIEIPEWLAMEKGLI